MWAAAMAAMAAVLGVVALRLWLSLPGRWRANLEGKAKCLVVLGSGGHTTEMLYDLASLGALGARLELTYLIAETDRGSSTHADAFERERGAGVARAVRVPRAREVGQSYSSSVWTTLWATWVTIGHVMRLLPDLVFCNGPGTCVPVVFAAYLCRFFGLKRVLVMYSESFACVDHLSLSGRLLYRVADRFTVQWPHLLQLYPKSEYAGRLYSEAEVQHCRISGALPPPADLQLLPEPGAAAGPPTAIVTVGSTKFDALIGAVDNDDLLSVLGRLGIRRLLVQRGSGARRPAALEARGAAAGVAVEVVEYQPDLARELRQAALVVSHAGAGTILDCLQAGRRLVVVPNEGLMANHQVQLGLALREQGLLFCFRAGELSDGLRQADFGKLRRFPAQGGAAFARCAGELLGWQPGASAQ